MVMSFLGSAAPTAAFVAITQTAGSPVLHRARPKRSGGRRAEAFLSREECGRSRQGKKAAGPAVAGPGCLPSDRPLEGRGACSSEPKGIKATDHEAIRRARRHLVTIIAEDMKRATS
jgi:hypothetical protein